MSRKRLSDTNFALKQSHCFFLQSSIRRGIIITVSKQSITRVAIPPGVSINQSGYVAKTRIGSNYHYSDSS